jgi:hypothetical protein
LSTVEVEAEGLTVKYRSLKKQIPRTEEGVGHDRKLLDVVLLEDHNTTS